MNLVELQEQLKGVPDDYLANHVRQPDGTVPQFMALAELQRRQDMRARFAGPPPTTTVADDILQRQSGIGASMPNGQPQQPGGIIQPGNTQGPPMPQQAPSAPRGFSGGGIVASLRGQGPAVGYAPGGAVDTYMPNMQRVDSGNYNYPPYDPTEIVRRFEGLRLSPYNDVGGTPTVGYGHTGKVDGPITKERAEELLQQDLKTARDTVRFYVKQPLLPNEEAALTSATYNLGPQLFVNKDGKPTQFSKYLEAGDKQRAADWLLKFNKSKGKEIKGLTNRRNEERRMFLDPEAIRRDGIAAINERLGERARNSDLNVNPVNWGSAPGDLGRWLTNEASDMWDEAGGILGGAKWDPNSSGIENAAGYAARGLASLVPATDSIATRLMAGPVLLADALFGSGRVSNSPDAQPDAPPGIAPAPVGGGIAPVPIATPAATRKREMGGFATLPSSPNPNATTEISTITETAPIANDPAADLYRSLAAHYDSMRTSKAERRNMAMLQAGLGIMAGDSPWAGVNIGRGGMAGVQAYQQQGQQDNEIQSRAIRDQIDLMNVMSQNRRADAELGMRREQLDISRARADAYVKSKLAASGGQGGVRGDAAQAAMVKVFDGLVKQATDAGVVLDTAKMDILWMRSIAMVKNSTGAIGGIAPNTDGGPQLEQGFQDE